jgi:hypothetical protein
MSIFDENMAKAATEALGEIASLVENAIRNGEGPQEHADEMLKIFKDVEEKYGINFNDVPDQIAAAIPSLSAASPREMLSSILGGRNALGFILGIPVPQNSDDDTEERELHNLYHGAGATPNHYNRKDFSVHAIQYHGSANQSEVANFCIENGIPFSISGESFIIGGRSGSKTETIALDVSEWLLYKPEDKNWTIRGCESFVMEYELPISIQREQKADEEFEQSAAAERDIEDTIDDLLADES